MAAGATAADTQAAVFMAAVFMAAAAVDTIMAAVAAAGTEAGTAATTAGMAVFAAPSKLRSGFADPTATETDDKFHAALRPLGA